MHRLFHVNAIKSPFAMSMNIPLIFPLRHDEFVPRSQATHAVAGNGQCQVWTSADLEGNISQMLPWSFRKFAMNLGELNMVKSS